MMVEATMNVPQAVEDCHELLKWVIPQVEKFPRARRFTLGERIEVRLLDVLELLTVAAYASDKRQVLIRANRGLTVVRHLWRLAFELRVVPTRQFEYGARLMVELGRQVGGWLKSRPPRSA